MEVLAAKFVPVPDGEGGVLHEPKGYRTIDLFELQERFKDFGLKWPDGEIRTLQKLRNDFEHYHSTAPKEVIRQAIVACFPLIQGFFALVEIQPAAALGDAWLVMLNEEAFFAKQKADADATFHKLRWGERLCNTSDFCCPSCGSSLICQVDPSNSDPQEIEGRCIACGAALTAEKTVELIVDAEFSGEAHAAAMDGGDSVINDCPECGNDTYVTHDNFNECLLCGCGVEGECGRCWATLSVHNRSVNNPSLCDYCDHVMSRDD